MTQDVYAGLFEDGLDLVAANLDLATRELRQTSAAGP
jgi:hypothetical protein